MAWPVWAWMIQSDFPAREAAILQTEAVPALTIVLLVLVRPVLEEVVFRGLVQGNLLHISWGRRQWMGFTVANAVTSLLFSLVHVFYHPILMASLVFVPSMIFGYFRDRYKGRLLPSMILHAYYNGGFLLSVMQSH